MPFDISGTRECLTFTSSRWPVLLDLAREHGWDPAGTCLKPEYVVFQSGPDELHPTVAEVVLDWQGYYEANNFQTVRAEDAEALADALERALPSIWQPRLRADVEDLIRLARAGEFEIA